MIASKTFTLIFTLCTPLKDGPSVCHDGWHEAGYSSHFECKISAALARVDYRLDTHGPEPFNPLPRCIDSDEYEAGRTPNRSR